MKLRALLLALMMLGLLAPPRVLADDDDDKAPETFAPDDFLVKAVVGPRGDGTYVLPTTQAVHPAGKTVLFPGRPVGVALSPDRKLLAVKNLNSLIFMDMARRETVQTLPFPAKLGAGFCGVVWSADGSHVWTTTAARQLIGAVRGKDGLFKFGKPIILPGGVREDGSYRRYDQGVPLPGASKDSAPGGLALDEARGLAYVTLSINNTLAVVDLAAGRIIGEIPVGIAPYDVRMGGANKAYVTNWGGRRPRQGDLTGLTAGSPAVIDKAGVAASGTVSVIDLESRSVVKEITVDLHPCGMAFSPDKKRLYVANANSDTISVIDTATDAAVARWIAKPMKDLPLGSAPNALAASPDGKLLYAALGGNNCLAVIDAASGAVTGLIPTGWYPGDLCLDPQSGVLCVANTKGVGSRLRDADAKAQKAAAGFSSRQHLGSVSFIDVPDEARLKEYTFQAAANMRLPRMEALLKAHQVSQRATPVPTRPGERSVFKHVLYIIKENRTYDQVFGDMPQGDGDPSLVHFGREVTPNHHALAEEFVLLDNFYCNGVLSADGHQWTNEGFVTDYLEKSFGGFTRSYPYEGDDVMAFASSGFIWDQALRAGLTFRDYGEMVQARITPKGATWKQIYEDYKTGARTVKITAKTPVRGLEPYIHPNFVGFPLTVPDVYRADMFIKELREFEAKGELPNFIIMLLPGDHTSAARPGLPTPNAAVADNDLALGRIVEAVSHSRFWPETAIFVVEDDPQAGLDHVDGHRTVALCVSPYTRRGAVEHTHYNQTGMLRTIELILGVGPLTQLTMAANPMVECFTEQPNLKPYDCKKNNIPLDQLNPPLQALSGKPRYWAQKSNELDLSDVDRADEATFNRILWHVVKGYDVPYPTLKPVARANSDDDADESAG